MVTRITIEIIPSLRRGKFHKIILHLNDDNIERTVNLNMDFQPLWAFSRDTSSVAYDFLLFSTIIYGIDRFINRELYSLEGWTREIIVEGLPVIHKNEFNANREAITHTLNFLTGDLWDINFSEKEELSFYPSNSCQDWGEKLSYSKVSLFSGGLDSLIGLIDQLEQINDSKVIFVSHKDLGKEGKDQDSIMDQIRSNNLYTNKFIQIQTKAGLGKKKFNPVDNETTFRSRSLLFIGMGIYIANSLGINTPLVIPENGTISLNLPLFPSRRSACSTRTTHPTFIKRLQGVLEGLGMHHPLVNPYEFVTKGEMIRDTKNTNVLASLLPYSCSCAKRGHNYYWDRTGIEIHADRICHCGMCLPCIYRRVSLHLNGLDNQINSNYGTDVFNGIKFNYANLNQHSSRDFRALLEFIRQDYSNEEISRVLIKNGLTNLENLEDYTLLISRTIDQIKSWLNAKANIQIKQKAGL